ncbi:MAG: FabA-like domain protein [Verrucomicrobia bacterium]|jgi:3-hydroxyacyl-[acyl-carrier-protein] dehydratase|nr:FabA-like domain protein [Verrucomicrobiota bacterium]
MATTQLKEEEIRESLKRCSEQTIEAAIAFHKTREPDLVPTIVLGIIERFIEPDVRPVIREGDDSTRLLEDLGIDSLLMVEIVILIEETLDIQIENEELRSLRSMGDIKAYLDAKIKGLPLPSSRNVLSFEQLAAVMPHQPPFLFLHEARINGLSAEGTYRISGDEAFLEGHFKDRPVFPASLMLEALGQLAVLFLLKGKNEAFADEPRPESIFFVSCDGVRCHKTCAPGDILQLSVNLKKVHAPIAQFEGTILSDGVKVAKAEEISLTFETNSAAAEA